MAITLQSKIITALYTRLQTVAYAGFSRGRGARKFRKFENNEHQNENFLQPESVRLSAQH